MASLLDLFKVPSTSSFPTANPATSQALSTIQNGSKAPNFQTLSGQSIYVPPPTAKAPTSSQSVGVKAKAPTDNVAPPTTTIASQYQKPQTTSPVIGGQDSGGTTNPNYNTFQMAGGTGSGTTAPGILDMLVANGQGTTSMNPTTQAALDRYNQISKNIADLRGQGEAGQAGYLTGGLTLPVSQGRAQILGQTEAAQEQALGAQQQAALQAANVGINQQQTNQNALGTALGAATQTVQAPYSTPLYAPASGQFINSAGGTNGGVASLDSAVNNAVNLIKSGSGYANAVATLSNYGAAGEQALLQKLGPGFNINASNAQAAAQAQNIGTTATTVKNTAAEGYSQSYQAYQNLNQAYTGAQNLGNLLAQTMEKGGINSNGSIDLNQAANTLAHHLSSADYANFVSTLNSAKNAYQQILTTAGSTPTGAEASLLSTLDPSYSMNAIISAINQLNQEVYSGKIIPSAQQANQYLQLLNQ